MDHNKQKVDYMNIERFDAKEWFYKFWGVGKGKWPLSVCLLIFAGWHGLSSIPVLGQDQIGEFSSIRSSNSLSLIYHNLNEKMKIIIVFG